MLIPQRPAIILFLVAVFALALPAGAQQVHGSDVFFGYSRTGNNTFYRGAGGLNAWELTLHVHMRPFVGVEGDVARYGMGADASVPRTTTVLLGPRLTTSVPGTGVHLFGHFLVGGEHSSNQTGSVSGGTLAYALGAGLDWPVAPFFAWRVQGDRISAPNQSPDSGTHARFSTGLVFRF